MTDGLPFHKWLQSLKLRCDALAKMELEPTLRDRVALIDELNMFEGFHIEQGYQLAKEMIRNCLGVTEARWPHLLRLRTKEELRRALRYSPHKPVTRFGDETVYPRDGWLGRYIEAHGHMEVPLAWHFWAAVAVFGVACRRNFVLDRGNHYVWPNQYVLLIGPTTERKTTACAHAVAVFRAYNRMLEEKSKGLVPARNMSVALHQGRGTPQPWLNKLACTTQMAVNPLTQLPYNAGREEAIGFLVNDEVVNIIGSRQNEASTWIAILTALYTPMGVWNDETLNRGDKTFRNIAISCLLASTPSWLRESCTPEVFDGGFIGRCMFVYRESSNRIYSKAAPVDPIIVESLAEELLDLSFWPECEMQVSPQVEAWFDEWYTEEKPNRPADNNLIGWHGRKPEHIWKLAIVLALTHRRTEILMEDLVMARNIIQNEEQFLPQCFGELTANTLAQLNDLVYHGIVKRGGTVNRTELYNFTSRRVGDKRKLDEIVETLRAEGRIKIESKGEGKHRTTYYHALHDHGEVGSKLDTRGLKLLNGEDPDD